MEASKSFRPHISARAATAILSGTATILFGLVVANRSNAAAEQAVRRALHPHHHWHFARIQWGWDVLPVVPLATSVLWNFLTAIILASGTYFWLPRRMHLSLDLVISVMSIVLGYMTFVWNVISVKSSPSSTRLPQPPMPKQQVRMMVGGVVVLTVVAVAHLVFFCYGCRKQVEDVAVIEESKAEAQQPPVYVLENPFDDDARSARSLPVYEKGDFEVEDEKKERFGISVVEVEGDMV